jgi:hypothetical protein
MFRLFCVLILVLLVCAVTDAVTGADVPAPPDTEPVPLSSRHYYAPLSYRVVPTPPAWYYAPPVYPPVYRVPVVPAPVPVVPYYVLPPRPRHHGPHDRHWLDLRAPCLRLGIGW